MKPKGESSLSTRNIWKWRPSLSPWIIFRVRIRNSDSWVLFIIHILYTWYTFYKLVYFIICSFESLFNGSSTMWTKTQFMLVFILLLQHLVEIRIASPSSVKAPVQQVSVSIFSPNSAGTTLARPFSRYHARTNVMLMEYKTKAYINYTFYETDLLFCNKTIPTHTVTTTKLTNSLRILPAILIWAMDTMDAAGSGILEPMFNY